MRFETWVGSCGMTRSEVARRIGVSPAMIHMVLCGKKRFSPEKARRVVALTNGQVSLEEILFPERCKASGE